MMDGHDERDRHGEGRAHDDVEELLGAYALDAVDEDERRRVANYLQDNPRARAEVESYQEVAARLSFDGGNPPAGVWDRIAASIDADVPSAGPELRQLIAPEPAARRRWRAWAVGAGAVAASVIAAVAVTVAVVDDGAGSDTQSAIEEAFGEAWSDAEGRRARLESVDGELRADAVVLPDGIGFVSAESLPALDTTETYQLWGVYGDGDVISLGVIGNDPGIEPFRAKGDIGAVVVTRERAGGVESSTSGALLSGDLE